MNYRDQILDMTRLYTAQTYGLPVAAYWLAKAVEQVCDCWFINCRPDGYDFECGMDAQEAVADALLAHLVKMKFVELERAAKITQNNY